MGFVHLHVHSEYSLLQGACRIESLVEQASALHFQALAVTDKNVMYGAVPFYKACRDQGIKPILGMEINVEPMDGQMTDRKDTTLVLLAKSAAGYRQLIQLSSLVMLDRYRGGIEQQQLADHSDGLIALMPAAGGEIAQASLAGRYDAAKRVGNAYKKIFGEDFYLAMEDHGVARERQLNLDLAALSSDTGIPLAATNRVHYLQQEDALAHDCMLCIKNGEKLEDEDREKLPTNEFYLKSEGEMQERFSHVSEALANTERIADQCEIELLFGEPVLPQFPAPDGMDAAAYLRSLCQQGMNKRYGTVTDALSARLEHELSIIIHMQFSDYFLIVWDFMKHAYEQGITTGPGRGSAAGSLVAYVLGITNVDPIRHDLLFERFLNPERVTMPDIDIDFPDTRRDEMIRYVAEKYGHEHVAQIVTFGTLAARAAVRDVGRVMDAPVKLIDTVAKHIPSRPGITLEEAKQESAALKKMLAESDDATQLYQIAKTIEGFPRHTSTHAAGIVISKDELTATVPLQEGQEGMALTQYPMDILEELGLLKMDFLGLRNLSLIEDILDRIEQGEGKRIPLTDLSFDDAATFKQLQAGDTTGVFQLESEGMREVLKKLQPTEFEDIVAVNALYRPGPMANIPTYISGKHGEREITYFHKDLEPILESTYGVIVYQEQIMQIASKMAGFTLGEADLLRRAVSKKKREILDTERDHFVTGCLDKGYDRATADGLYDLIVRFADYGFNRSHAVAYSIIAYQLAYLKANYSRYFMAALLSSVAGGGDKLEQYVHELQIKNIPLYLPSVNHSEWGFTAEGEGIRFGLHGVKNVGERPIRELLKQRRKTGPYRDLFDLCARVPQKTLSRRALESLIFAGGMDEFGVERARLVVSLDAALDYGEAVQQKAADGQMQWFEAEGGRPGYEEVPPFALAEKLRYEKEALGFYLTAHPLDQYRRLLARIEYDPIHTIRAMKEETTARAAGMVTKARYIKTKKGDPMAFITMNDQSGDLEVVVFPKMYQRTPLYFEEEQFLLIEGKVQTRDGTSQLVATRAIPLDEIKARSRQKGEPVLYLKIGEAQRRQETMAAVKELLRRFHGEAEVILYYEMEGATRQLPESLRVNPTAECLRLLRDQLSAANVVLRE